MSFQGEVASVTRSGVGLDRAAGAAGDPNAAHAAQTVVAIRQAGDRCRGRRLGPGRACRKRSNDADICNGAV